MASKVGAFESLRVLTLPDVRVALWIELEIDLRSSSRTAGNHGLSRQFAFTTTALAGLFWRKNSSMASFFRRGFQLAHSSDPSFRIVGRNNDRLRALRVCASSTHAMSKPSRPLERVRLWDGVRGWKLRQKRLLSAVFCWAFPVGGRHAAALGVA
jgi:hypothetical protein